MSFVCIWIVKLVLKCVWKRKDYKCLTIFLCVFKIFYREIAYKFPTKRTYYFYTHKFIHVYYLNQRKVPALRNLQGCRRRQTTDKQGHIKLEIVCSGPFRDAAWTILTQKAHGLGLALLGLYNIVGPTAIAGIWGSRPGSWGHSISLACHQHHVESCRGIFPKEREYHEQKRDEKGDSEWQDKKLSILPGGARQRHRGSDA